MASGEERFAVTCPHDNLCRIPGAEPGLRLGLRLRMLASLALIERDGDACWYCWQGFDGATKRTLEHLIPLSAGGPEWCFWNLALACERCNALVDRWRLRSKLAVKLAFETRVNPWPEIHRLRALEMVLRRSA